MSAAYTIAEVRWRLFRVSSFILRSFPPLLFSSLMSLSSARLLYCTRTLPPSHHSTPPSVILIVPFWLPQGDLDVIRPLAYTREVLMRDFAKAAKLPVINENCPVRCFLFWFWFWFGLVC